MSHAFAAHRPRTLSIGRRLSLLVVFELLTAAFIVTTAIVTLRRLAQEQHYMHAYLVKPLVWVGDALEAATTLAEVNMSKPPDAPARAREAVGRVDWFLRHYESEWQVVQGTTPDAVRLRAKLEAVDKTGLLADEQQALNALDVAVRSAEGSDAPKAADLAIALIRLNRVNLAYMEAAYDAYKASTTRLTAAFLAVGLLGMFAAPLFGLSVRRAIAPRVKQLVQKIHRFRDYGLNEPIQDTAGDELTILGRTLDTGFAAIAARDEERKRFLAIAAHELKTPLTTIKGFSQVALEARNDPALRDRALGVIDRQATRLAHLAQDLLWVARVQAGNLPFRPVPVEVASLAARAIDEVSILVKNPQFSLDVRGDTHLLGDVTLLEHSLVSLLVEAATLTRDGTVQVRVDGESDRVRIAVATTSHGDLPQNLERLAEPFAILQFEGVGEARGTGIGLHLVREISMLHGGSFRTEPRPGGGLVFALDIPR